MIRNRGQSSCHCNAPSFQTHAMISPSSSFSLLRLLSLRSDEAEPDAIDASVRDSARLGGTNLWVLMFAIMIASVGLNVNSTAVIIGAMLISPLMGPIIGIGYGAGVHDYTLIRNSLRNLALFVGISLFASVLYFLLTPLKQAHSELLARTSPTLWDVLIAFFGGAAGMIGLSRREKTTLIPGVAIATALMPPLCTTGYGIATGQPRIFLGAFFLFLINSVFIALATLAIVRVLRLPHHAVPDEMTRRRGQAIIAIAVTLTLAPSIYLAVRLVQDEFFSAAAEKFLVDVTNEREDLTLISRTIDPQQRLITATMIGSGVTPEIESTLNRRLATAGLNDARLKIRRPSEAGLDVTAVRSLLEKDMLQAAVAAGEAKTRRIEELEAQLARLNATIGDLDRVEKEIRAQLPKLRNVVVTGSAHHTNDGKSRLYVLVAIDDPKGLSSSDSARLKRWLKARLPGAEIDLVVGRIVAG